MDNLVPSRSPRLAWRNVGWMSRPYTMRKEHLCVLVSFFFVLTTFLFASDTRLDVSCTPLIAEVPTSAPLPVRAFKESRQEKHQFGVNVFAYIRGEFGVAESGRAATAALIAAGIPIVVMDLNTIHPSIHRHNDTRFESYILPTVQTPYYFNLFILNADMSNFFYQKIGEEHFRDHYSIASWAWELDVFPDFWYKAFSCFDELWGETNFVTNSVRAVSPIPVVTMKYPLTVMLDAPITNKEEDKGETEPTVDTKSFLSREYFNLTSNDFIFWLNFDYYSFVERKNPHAVLKAFRKASPLFKENLGEGVGDALGEAILVVKTNNVNGLPHFREQSNELRKLAEGLNVRFIEQTLTTPEMKSLYHHCDCYVSLHRSEGMGLGIPHAMYNKKPVIVTNYSGPVDYVTDETTYAVKYSLKTIESDLGPYTKGNHWADADVDQAAQHMVDVYQDRKRAQQKAQNAHEHIRDMYSPAKTGQAVRERLNQIWERREGINFYNSFKHRNYGH